jgi:hypothetical protein
MHFLVHVGDVKHIVVYLLPITYGNQNLLQDGVIESLQALTLLILYLRFQLLLTLQTTIRVTN